MKLKLPNIGESVVFVDYDGNEYPALVSDVNRVAGHISVITLDPDSEEMFLVKYVPPRAKGNYWRWPDTEHTYIELPDPSEVTK